MSLECFTKNVLIQNSFPEDKSEWVMTNFLPFMEEKFKDLSKDSKIYSVPYTQMFVDVDSKVIQVRKYLWQALYLVSDINDVSKLQIADLETLLKVNTRCLNPIHFLCGSADGFSLVFRKVPFLPVIKFSILNPFNQVGISFLYFSNTGDISISGYRRGTVPYMIDEFLKVLLKAIPIKDSSKDALLLNLERYKIT